MSDRQLGNQPVDQVRVYIIRHPSFAEGEEIANVVAARLEGPPGPPGAYPIATRVLCEAADPSIENGEPQYIEKNASVFSVAIFLADKLLTEAMQGPWSAFRKDLTDAIPSQDEQKKDAYILPLIVATDEEAVDPLNLGKDTFQAERAFEWPHPLCSEASVTRILLHTYRLILSGLELNRFDAPTDAGPVRRQVFLSHAKADLKESERADRVAVVDRLRQRMNDSNYGLSPYFDATHALPGFRWRNQFIKAIKESSFVAVATDNYASRPECQWELLEAKRARKPILSVNAIRDRETVSFAYGGNLPSSRVDRLDDGEVDELLLDLMTEIARMELWLREAQWVTVKVGLPDAVLLPRQAELVDLAFYVLDHRSEGDKNTTRDTLVYPDPPLSDDLFPLIEALKPDNLDILPLSQLRAKLWTGTI